MRLKSLHAANDVRNQPAAGEPHINSQDFDIQETCCNLSTDSVERFFVYATFSTIPF